LSSEAERLLPVLGPVGQLVEIIGSGFDPDPAGNSVTFQGESNGRIEATVASAGSDKLEVRVPQEAISGPVRVTVGGLTGNDYQFFVLFRPDAGVFFPDFKAGQPVGPLLVLSDFPSPRLERLLDQDVPFDSLGVVLDQGNIKTDTLEIGQAAGTASVMHNDGSGTPTDYLLVYAGHEEEGERRHVFDLEPALEDTYCKEHFTCGKARE